MRLVPWLLILLRLGLAPVLVGAAEGGLVRDAGVLLVYLVAFASDYFDGAIARRCGVATRRLREADSTADAVFHVALGWVTWRLHPDELRAHALALDVFAATLLAWYVLDAFRWRRAAGFHAYSAKLFSVALGVWVVALYGGFTTGALLPLALALGVVSNLEGLAISLTLAHPETDVPTLVHARRRRAAGAALSGRAE